MNVTRQPAPDLAEAEPGCGPVQMPLVIMQIATQQILQLLRRSVQLRGAMVQALRG